MKDECLKHWLWLMQEIKEEHINQINKWGIQEHDISDWFLFTGEEFGELAEAIGEYKYRDGDIESVVKEAIQTAVLCLKIAEMFYCIKYE